MAPPAPADSVDVFGVKVKVDAAEALSGGAVRIRISGAEQVVAQDQAADFVLGVLASRKSSASIKVNDLKAIVETATEKDSVKTATEAMILLFNHPDFDTGREEAFLWRLSHIPQSRQVMRNCVLAAISDEGALRRDLIPPLLFYAGIHDVEWMRQNGVILAYRNFPQVKEYIRGQFIKIFSGPGTGSPEEVLALMSALLGENDQDLKHMRGVKGKIETLQGALKARNLTEVLSILGQKGSRRRVDSVTGPIVRDLIYQESERLLGDGSFTQVLLLLSRVDVSTRTPRAHELVRAALRGLGESGGDYDVLSGGEVQEMLASYSADDPAVRAEYIRLLAKKIGDLLSKGDPSSVDDVFGRILTLRSDPSRENDRIRIAQTKAFLSTGQEAAAIEKLSGVHTKLTFSDRAWFTFYRLLHKTPLIIYVLILVVLAAMIVSYRILSVRAGKRLAKRWHDLGWNGYSTGAGSDGRPFVVRELREQIDPAVQEYFECLRVFNLNPGATVREIKSAYRKRMKEVHPDLHVRDEGVSSKEFVRIRQAYEALLRMEKGAVPLQFRK